MPFGGSSLADQTLLLDTLQREVNAVLEQTGRLLATSTIDNNKPEIGARAAKLKFILPGAERRLNEALDGLSEEIEHARRVLRRDLAVGGGHGTAPKPVTPVPDKPQEDTQPSSEAQPAVVSPPNKIPESDAAPADVPQAVPEPEDGLVETTTATEAEVKSAVPTTPPPPQPASETDKAANPTLDDNNNDAGDTDFDFGLPTTESQTDFPDNDNISALLPGLQDYANNEPDGVVGEDPVFDDIFGDGADLGGGDAGMEQGNAGNGDGMDGMDSFLDFDFGAFSGADPGAGGNGDDVGTGNGNVDGEEDFFKFD